MAAKSNKRDPILTEESYHSPELNGSPYLKNALRLLSMAMGRIDRALEFLADEDKTGVAMQRYQLLLPELFACRSLGEGFGLIVSSLQNAATRLPGHAMDEQQIRTVRSALAALRSDPFMTFDAAMAHVSSLEHADLNVNPPKFEYLADLLSE